MIDAANAAAPTPMLTATLAPVARCDGAAFEVVLQSVASPDEATGEPLAGLADKVQANAANVTPSPPTAPLPAMLRVPDAETSLIQAAQSTGADEPSSVAEAPIDTVKTPSTVINLPFGPPTAELSTTPLPLIVAQPEQQVPADSVPSKRALNGDRVEIQVSADIQRVSPAPAMASERPQPFVFDRGAAFTPFLMQAARDVVSFAGEADVRFNVRPEVLGPVAVTIERTDAGPSLRLNVETAAAAQVVKTAETMLNDPRGNVQFVQVTVDLNSPEQRGRAPRPALPQRQVTDARRETLTERAVAAPGRYA